MKLLHTSDWHLGRSLYNQPRYSEFEQWLTWLIATLQSQAIDVLIIAGDIFDTTTPSNKAQQQYYNFLLAASRTCCQHIVVVGGNHDSPTFLNAPKSLLHVLNVHVVGSAEDNPQDEVLTLHDHAGNPMAIVCAVPYLRDRDIRQFNEQDSANDKNQAMLQGLQTHYNNVCEHALTRQTQLHSQYDGYIPIIATGHLFAAGASSVEGDGMRDLYVGSLAYVTADIFPACIDYVALGHLHSCQMVGKNHHIRYSGSPLAMSFAEATKTKYVLCVQWQANHAVEVEPIAIPSFQPLQTLQGNLSDIKPALQALTQLNHSVWVEVHYTDPVPISDLRQQLQALVLNSQVQILRIKTQPPASVQGLTSEVVKPLSHWNETEVFEQRMQDEVPAIADSDKATLRALYQQVLTQIHEKDTLAS